MPTNLQPHTPWRTPRVRVRALLVWTVAIAAVLAFGPQPASASDTTTRWDSFSESSGCGEPFTRTPVGSAKGWLSDSEAILGPFGTYFGRSVAEVRSHLRDWTVPNSGGHKVRVHEEMLPALKRVGAALRAHAAEGRVYEISSAHAFTPRTIGGSYRISRHAMGLAIDLNPAQNPYRGDNVLITDMPEWFVDAWRDAGFCWGGDWRGSKDTMHFSWMGPESTAYSGSLTPAPPDTSKTSFGGPVASHETQFGPVMPRYEIAIADANSNGTSDVVGLRAHPGGSVIDIALSSLGFGYCSIGRWFIPDESVAEADHVVMADVDGDSGQDLVALSTSEDSVVATTATRRNGFQDPTSSNVGASVDAIAFTGADFDGDHQADLWEVTAAGEIRIWSGPSFAQVLDESTLPGGAPSKIAAGDRDGGNTPELYALYESSEASRIDVLTYDGVWSLETSITVGDGSGGIEAIGAGDYDGDGRADAQVLTAAGDLVVYVGNSSTGVPASRWFLYPDWDCDQPVLLDYAGSFMDDESSIFVSDIESIAATGVTKGCNPPFNDRFCPTDPVSRGQMAAFLVRALDLTAETHPGFTDVPADSTFADDIAKLATAGITRGCDPPDNDRYCPDEPVSREQMAAFLTRALDLAAVDHPAFADVPADSTFVTDIRKLATAGITRGCNPPGNDRFCPEDNVTRGQMAAFLDRAGLGSR